MQNNEVDVNQTTVDQQLEAQLNPPVEMKEESEPVNNKKGRKEKSIIPDQDMRVMGIGDWMITILFYIIPVINIIMMAFWAFSSRGNANRRNLSRACLLWIIVILIAYVAAMAIAGYTILRIFDV